MTYISWLLHIGQRSSGNVRELELRADILRASRTSSNRVPADSIHET